MSSGVYRLGDFINPARSSMRFYRDGKTATISVVDVGTMRSIRTNGKSDAGLQMDDGARALPDEYTMVLAAALPLMLNPKVRDVANIGFGSGLTTHALLGSPQIARLDSIEIERMMIEGARLYAPRNARAFADPRNHIHIEDAKTFFAANAQRYDLIVSEPSNPWVSGTATLFSEEFYAQMRRYLNADGLLVQWVQAYEINVPLLSTIFTALGKHFGDYAVYRTGADLLVIATPAARLPQPSAEALSFTGLAQDLQRLGIRGLGDLEAMRVGGRAALEPLFLGYGMPANSDYYPILDQRAARARFKDESAVSLPEVRLAHVPVLALLDRDTRQPLESVKDIGRSRTAQVDELLAAGEALGIALSGSANEARALSPRGQLVSLLARRLADDCPGAQLQWIEAVSEVAYFVMPFIAERDVAVLLQRMRASRCGRSLDEAGRHQLDFLEAANARDARRMGAAAEWLLGNGKLGPAETRDCVTAVLLAALVDGDIARVRDVADRHLRTLSLEELRAPSLQLVLAHLARPRTQN